MSTLHPVHVGSDPSRDPPETLLEVTVTVEHRRGVPPAEMLDAAHQVVERIGRALDEANFADLPIRRISPDVAWKRRGSEPLFPARMGGRWFASRLDVVEAVERMCGGTELANLAYDFAGRAYEVSVDVRFSRVQAEDRFP